MSKPLVIYHGGGCRDGFTAAWASRRYFKGDADFLPASYGDDPPDAAGREIYVLDFNYPRFALLELCRRAACVTVLDHHRSAAADLDGLGGPKLRVKFDMDKSGAALAWEHFFPLRPAPLLVEYVQDRDLWRWELAHSREVNAWLSIQELTFENWDAVAERLTGQLGSREVEHGATVLACQKAQVAAICRNAREVDVAGHKVLAANTPLLQSEVAGELASGRAFGACYYDGRDGVRRWSLRSREGGIDVSEVARLFGGGGHAQAAGYEERP